MPNGDEFGGYDGEGQGQSNSGGGALRKQYEDALKELKDLKVEVESLRTEKVARSKVDLLTAAGVPADLHELYPGDASEEAITKWVEKFGEKLGIEKADQPETPEVQAQAAFQQVQDQLQQGALPPNQKQQLIDEARQKIKARSGTPEEFAATVQKLMQLGSNV